MVVIVAPLRGNTMNNFIDLAKDKFNIELDYCEKFKSILNEKVLPQTSSIDSDLIPHLINLKFK